MPGPSRNGSQLVRPKFSLKQVQCPVPSCRRWFRNLSGRTKHIRFSHGPQGAMSLSPHVHQRRLSSGLDRDRMHVSDAHPCTSSTFTDTPSQDTQSPPASRQNLPLLNITALQMDERSHTGSWDPWLSSPGQHEWLHPSSPSPSGRPLESLPPCLSPEPAAESRETPISRVYHPFINGKDVLLFIASMH
jgi:hypothetical protein